MKSHAVTFASGLLFALGLGLSGMTHPLKVLAFLDVAGAWDPSLALVMGGAVAVTLVLYRVALRRGRPVLAEAFDLPTQHAIDGRLVGGAALFGIGWGLSGYCPGPALVSLATGSPAVWLFVAAMVGGMMLFQLVDTRRARRDGRWASSERAEHAHEFS